MGDLPVAGYVLHPGPDSGRPGMERDSCAVFAALPQPHGRSLAEAALRMSGDVGYEDDRRGAPLVLVCSARTRVFQNGSRSLATAFDSRPVSFSAKHVVPSGTISPSGYCSERLTLDREPKTSHSVLPTPTLYVRNRSRAIDSDLR